MKASSNPDGLEPVQRQPIGFHTIEKYSTDLPLFAAYLFASSFALFLSAIWGHLTHGDGGGLGEAIRIFYSGEALVLVCMAVKVQRIGLTLVCVALLFLFSPFHAIYIRGWGWWIAVYLLGLIGFAWINVRLYSIPAETVPLYE